MGGYILKALHPVFFAPCPLESGQLAMGIKNHTAAASHT